MAKTFRSTVILSIGMDVDGILCVSDTAEYNGDGNNKRRRRREICQHQWQQF